MHRFASTLIVAAAACLLTACGEGTSPGGSAAKTDDRPGWLLTSAPANPSDIAETKRIAKEGDEVVLRGVIGGRVDAMSDDNALFVLMDVRAENGCTEEGDGCKTPWDYCCATPEMLAANNATVQLVDGDGRPVGIDLRTKGISPLDTVVVVGVVGPRPTADVLTVKASSIYKVP